MHRCQAYFLTGTDTGIGKTHAACALLMVARGLGLSAVGMKPVAAGCAADGSNDDVDRLIASSSAAAPAELVNPYRFRAAIAPHLASIDERRPIDPKVIVDACDRLKAVAEFLVVEGVGGFCVPLGDDCDAADLAQFLALPVILVVGMRLGCLNHALLTAEAIHARGLGIAGWIANRIDPSMDRWQDNLAALKERLAAPLLGVLPHDEGADVAAAALCLTLPPRSVS